jgi:hypothetical protein
LTFFPEPTKAFFKSSFGIYFPITSTLRFRRVPTRIWIDANPV